MLNFCGLSDKAARFLQKEQLSDPTVWARFVDVYRSQPDSQNQGWRGEYWGKMMRGAALVYDYTRDDALYETLTDTVCDMLTVIEHDGRVSTYKRDAEFDSWDIWSRKYVMLGCEYYYDVCRDEGFKAEILAFLCRLADYITEHIGEGKKKITSASRSWYGVNSSSILEPFVRLYNLTGNKRYLDFSEYIVNEGGAIGINIFELAYENKLLPYQYGVSKAYEMTSCFEGLLEYYYVTKIEKYKTAVLNYANAVLNSEISIIGSCGITHELFDHTRTRQTVKYDGVMQETCVTVTWMKFCSRILELTKDSVYADEMERSFYNAYLGAINTEFRESPYILEKFGDRGVRSTYLAFDSYSPLTPGKRGAKVGGNQLMPDLTYYGCCACIGAAGVGVFLKHAITVDDDGITVNFFEKGSAHVVYRGVEVTLNIKTEYPLDGRIEITVLTDSPVEFTLKVRNPYWAQVAGGYMNYTRVWHNDRLEFDFDMPLVFHYPEHWEEDTVYTDMTKNNSGFHIALAQRVYHEADEDNYFAITKGPLTLGADSRLGKAPGSVFMPCRNAEICEPQIADGASCLLKLKFSPENGEEYCLVDYSSAGRDWESVISAWLPTE